MLAKKLLIKFHKYDHFETWSSFAIGLVDVFIPIFLYQKGFAISQLCFFFLITSVVSCLFYIPICYYGNKSHYKFVLIFSVFFFFLAYYFLYMVQSLDIIFYLFVLFYSLYKLCYEIGKKYYIIVSMPLQNMSYYLAKVTVSTVIATLFASFIGSIFLKKYSIHPLLFLSSFIYMISLFFVFSSKIEMRKKKISLKEIFCKNKFSNLISIFFYECLEIEKFLFPLYLYFYILQKVEIIGTFNCIVSIFSFLFILNFSRRMDKKKKDYIFLSAFLLACVFLLKIEITSILMIYILGSIEGIVSSLYQVGMERNLYYTASHYETGNYVLYIETICNFSKFFFFLLLFLTKDIRMILFILPIGLLFSAFLPFDDGRGGYKVS